MDVFKFAQIDTSKNGILDKNELMQSLQGVWFEKLEKELSTKRNLDTQQVLRDAYTETADKIKSEIDGCDVDGNGEITGSQITNDGTGEVHQLRKLMSQNYVWDNDESSWPFYTSISIQKIKADIDEALRRVNIFDADEEHHSQQDAFLHMFADEQKSDFYKRIAEVIKSRSLTNEDLRANISAEVDKYAGKTIADIHDDRDLYPRIAVSDLEYDKWKIFRGAAGEDCILDVYQGRLPESSSFPADNSELQKFVESYATKSILNAQQQAALEQETRNDVGWSDADHKDANKKKEGFRFFMGGKQVDNFNIAMINKPGFEWNGAAKYKFYEIYNDYFKSHSLY